MAPAVERHLEAGAGPAITLLDKFDQPRGNGRRNKGKMPITLRRPARRFQNKTKDGILFAVTRENELQGISSPSC
jgi:hypothetical protein